eukprot:gene512-983_t
MNDTKDRSNGIASTTSTTSSIDGDNSNLEDDVRKLLRQLRKGGDSSSKLHGHSEYHLDKAVLASTASASTSTSTSTVRGRSLSENYQLSSPVIISSSPSPTSSPHIDNTLKPLLVDNNNNNMNSNGDSANKCNGQEDVDDEDDCEDDCEEEETVSRDNEKTVSPRLSPQPHSHSEYQSQLIVQTECAVDEHLKPTTSTTTNITTTGSTATAASATSMLISQSMDAMDLAQPLYAAAASVGIILPWGSNMMGGGTGSGGGGTALTSVSATSSIASTSTVPIPSPVIVAEVPFAAELAKFGLSTNERVVEFFSCALYPKRGMLTHGRLYLTQQYLAFAGWPDGRVLLSLQQIAHVERTSVFFVPNALLITTAVGEEYFFGSFLDRDQCYNMLTLMMKIAKRLVEMEFYSEHGQNNDDTTTSTSKSSDHIARIITPSSSGTNLANQFLIAAATDDNDNDDGVDDGIDLSKLFLQSKVAELTEMKFPFDSVDIWGISWLSSDGYKSFLSSEGDFDIISSDWKPFEGGPVPEDICNLPFSFSRTFTYQHPRTSMLMFGPKNATANQIQYLYIPKHILDKIKEDSIINKISLFQSLERIKLKPKQFVILTITDFIGIPVSDCFKILQYWSFYRNTQLQHGHNNKGNNSTTSTSGRNCIAKIGCHVHFVKSTMLKAQISAGTESELQVMSTKWCNFMKVAVTDKITRDRAAAAAAASLLLVDHKGDGVASSTSNLVESLSVTSLSLSTSSTSGGESSSESNIHKDSLQDFIPIRDNNKINSSKLLNDTNFFNPSVGYLS